MQTVKLFTDGSVDPKLNIGFGAYLLINDDVSYSDSLSEEIKIKKFENTSSTKLELETLLWALNNANASEFLNIIIYTDCQNILGLKGRRERFEKSNYITNKNKVIANHELYREFFAITDKLNCLFIKVKGHKVLNKKDEIDKFFTLVDRASRNSLRKNI